MKNLVHILLIFCAAFLLFSCSSSRKSNNSTGTNNNKPITSINTKNVTVDSVVAFAKTLIGIKYKYGSAVKENGFDCSGFITYVFNHFDIKVPRRSVDFTNLGTTVSLDKSKKGDLVLFTGSDNSSGVVGHMGIITQNKNGKVQFIHSASGNSKGVMISEVSGYFKTHFVKVVRIFF